MPFPPPEESEEDAADAAPKAEAPSLFNGRLAPPMELPSWETDEDTS